MPNEKRKVYPALENLSTEELEKLLAQDFVAPNTAEPDIDFILAVMEVIQGRNEEASGRKSIDVDTAWQEFQQDYQGHAESFGTGNPCGHESSQPEQIRKPRKIRAILRYAGIAAALIVLLSGVASAMGVNLFQVIAIWTAETFSFASGSSAEQQNNIQSSPENDPCSSLRAMVAEQTEIPLVPTWFPDGTEEYESVSKVERTDYSIITESFKVSTGEFSIFIQIYNEFPDEVGAIYQKDETPVEIYKCGEVNHYIFRNNSNYVAAWMNNNCEVCIQGNISVEDLKKMVDSIYQGVN